jgi:solute carrier family 7 (L-type amino acid transporter), member 5
LAFANSPLSLFQCLITILLLFIPDVYALINYVSFVEALFILMSISGLLYLRVKQPDAKRPIKVNLIFPIIFLITCSFLVISSCYVSPVEVGVGCLIIISGKTLDNVANRSNLLNLSRILGIPVYYATIHKPNAWLTRTSSRFNTFCSKLFLCVPMQENKEE